MKQKTPRELSNDARAIIADVYLVGSAPADPPYVLTDVTRSVSIVGRMLDGLTDRYSTPGKGLARGMTIAGSVLWGIVEIAVPDSFWSKITRNWYKLLTLCGVLIILLGLVTNTTGMASLGVELIFAVFVLRWLVSWLRMCMNTGDTCVGYLKLGLVVVGMVAVVGGLAWLVVLNSAAISGKLMWLSQKVASLQK